MKNFDAWFGFHRDAYRGGMRIMRKNWLATTLTIFTIVIMLSLAAILGMLSDVIRSSELDWHTNKQITLYLKPATSSLEEAQLLEKVSTTAGVAEARFNSPADAVIILQNELGIGDILSFLPANPLPAAIDVTPVVSINSKDKLQELFNTLKMYPNVDLARMDLESITRVSLFLLVIAKIFKVLILSILLALVLVIANALRLIISDRIDEIRVLKFIGATNRFIRRPYLYIGILYGFLAAIMTIIVVNFLLIGLRNQINDLLAAYEISYEVAGLTLVSCALVILISVTTGWLGARCATHRYLRN